MSNRIQYAPGRWVLAQRMRRTGKDILNLLIPITDEVERREAQRVLFNLFEPSQEDRDMIVRHLSRLDISLKYGADLSRLILDNCVQSFLPVYGSIPGLDGYCVGIDGSVWHQWVQVEGEWVIGLDEDWKKVEPTFNTSGYPVVYLSRAKKRRTFQVHQLVAMAFIGPYPDGMEVAHEDGDAGNPDLYNLSYKTKSDNSKDSVRHGTHRNKWNALVTQSEADVIREEREQGMSVREIANKHVLSASMIYLVLSEKTYPISREWV